MTAIPSRKRVAELHIGERPAGAIIMDAPSTRVIRLPPLIILGDRDLPKIAPKWLVTSESNGINDCCAGIVGEIAAARPVSSDTTR